MIPEHLSSDEVPHPFAQSHSGDLIVSGIRHPSFTCDATIDPMMLMGADHGLLSQHSSSSDCLYIPDGNPYHHPSPAPSTSAGVWMGYPLYEASASVSAPISPTVGDRVSALALDMIMLC